MRLIRYSFCSTEMYQDVQDTVNIPTFIAPGIELSITIGSGTAFAKAVIAFRVYHSILINCRQVSPPCPYIFASFQDDRFDTQLQQP